MTTPAQVASARFFVLPLLLLALAHPAQAQLGSNPAVNDSAKFAWQLFVDVSRPATNGTRDTVWETWAEQSDVYGDPNATPTWPSPEHRPKRLRPSLQRDVLGQEARARHTEQSDLLRRQGISEVGGPEFLPENPLSEEVRMNRATFDFIVGNKLWYIQGQIAKFTEGKMLSFPIDSREVKAQWRSIEPADKPRYHWQTGSDGKTYGLVALHLISKDLPNWVWATFEHAENPERCKVLGCQDNYGVGPDGNTSVELAALFSAAGMGEEWRHYRLDGAQIEFTDPTGRPTLLGNSMIEGPFMSTSSCITCHARATVNANGRRLAIFDANQQSHSGTPDPAWFWTATPAGQTMKFLQLDFVWSLILAQRRTAP